MDTEIADVQRLAPMSLTVVLNVVRHVGRESGQAGSGCPELDLLSLSLLELVQLAEALLLGIPQVFCLVVSQMLGLPVPYQHVQAVPRGAESAMLHDVAWAVLWACAVEQHLVLLLLRCGQNPHDRNT
jgi:hypothetical protein